MDLVHPGSVAGDPLMCEAEAPFLDDFDQEDVAIIDEDGKQSENVKQVNRIELVDREQYVQQVEQGDELEQAEDIDQEENVQLTEKEYVTAAGEQENGARQLANYADIMGIEPTSSQSYDNRHGFEPQSGPSNNATETFRHGMVYQNIYDLLTEDEGDENDYFNIPLHILGLQNAVREERRPNPEPKIITPSNKGKAQQRCPLAVDPPVHPKRRVRVFLSGSERSRGERATEAVLPHRRNDTPFLQENRHPGRSAKRRRSIRRDSKEVLADCSERQLEAMLQQNEKTNQVAEKMVLLKEEEIALMERSVKIQEKKVALQEASNQILRDMSNKNSSDILRQLQAGF